MPFRRLLAILVMALVLTGPALAADWVVLRLRGAVEVLVEDKWEPLKRGDIVAMSSWCAPSPTDMPSCSAIKKS